RPARACRRGAAVGVGGAGRRRDAGRGGAAARGSHATVSLSIDGGEVAGRSRLLQGDLRRLLSEGAPYPDRRPPRPPALQIEGFRGGPALATTLLRFLSIMIGLAAVPRADGDEWVLAHLTGVVRDDEGKPIPGVTVWWRDQYGVIPPHAGAAGGMKFGRGLTDADGRYRRDFDAKLGKPIGGLRVSAHARGFVRADVEFRSDEAVARAGETGALDIQLTRGDVLAGVVRVPLRLGARLEGKTPERQAFFV